VPHLQSDVHHILPQKRGYPWRDSGLVGAANIRWKQVLDNLYDGVIGNCRSAASISKDAGIDWCCLPEFNSSSVFARILDRGARIAAILEKPEHAENWWAISLKGISISP
jgi:GH15 family glucan-1,4-alpha-glucosidase